MQDELTHPLRWHLGFTGPGFRIWIIVYSRVRMRWWSSDYCENNGFTPLAASGVSVPVQSKEPTKRIRIDIDEVDFDK